MKNENPHAQHGVLNLDSKHCEFNVAGTTTWWGFDYEAIDADESEEQSAYSAEDDR